MTPILTAAEMRDADTVAIESLSIPPAVLMENAARGACEVMRTLAGGLTATKICILCGRGNNGGDGIALARLALIEGAEVVCVLLFEAGELSMDAALQHRILSSIASARIIRWDRDQLEKERFDLVVDAMLGTGSHGKPRGVVAEAIEWGNALRCPKLAIDIPTGLNSDTGSAEGELFRADATATMGALKPGLLLNAGPVAAGEITVVHIGAPHELYSGAGLQLLNSELARTALPAVARGRNKYDRGKVLVVGGSRGMTGAPVMSADAALRAGSGLVLLALPEAAANSLPQSVSPEIMTLSLPSGDDGAFLEEAADVILERAHTISAMAVGPGMSRSTAAGSMARRLVSQSAVPVVLDADGLNAWQGNIEGLREMKVPLVITPHHGEMARLLAVEPAAVASDPVAVARDAAARSGAIVVLKGAPTIVASPDGRCWINAAGNPGMATGGTGDVLTGVIVSLIGQHDDPLDATLAAVYLHSHAGDIAAAVHSERSMKATDITQSLGAAYRAILDL